MFFFPLKNSVTSKHLDILQRASLTPSLSKVTLNVCWSHYFLKEKKKHAWAAISIINIVMIWLML